MVKKEIVRIENDLRQLQSSGRVKRSAALILGNRSEQRSESERRWNGSRAKSRPPKNRDPRVKLCPGCESGWDGE